MSIPCLNWAKEHCAAHGPLRGIIMVLADHASPNPSLGTGDFHVCWPGQKTIAREAGWSVRCVEDNIPNLPDHNITVVSRRIPTPKGACNLYVFPISDSLEVPTVYVETSQEVPTSGVEVSTAGTEVPTSVAEVPTAAVDKPKPKPKEEPKLEPSPSSKPATAEDFKSFMEQVSGKVLLKDDGVGSGAGVTLDDLYRKIETLKIDPHKRIRAADIARKLWDDTEGGKRLGGKPVKDLLGLLMHRLQQEHVIKPKRR